MNQTPVIQESNRAKVWIINEWDEEKGAEEQKWWNFFTYTKLNDDPKVCNNKIRRKYVVS